MILDLHAGNTGWNPALEWIYPQWLTRSKSIRCFSQMINWLLDVSCVSFAPLCWLELLLPYDSVSQATSFKYYPAGKMKGRKRGSSQNTFVRKKRSVSQVCRLLMLLVSLAPHSFMTPFMVLLRAIYLLIYCSDNYKKCWSNLIIRSPAKNPLYIVSKPQILHTFRISLLTEHRLHRNKMNSIILTHRPLLPSIPSMVSLYNRRVLFDHIKLLERTKRLLTATLAWSWKIGR